MTTCRPSRSSPAGTTARTRPPRPPPRAPSARTTTGSPRRSAPSQGSRIGSSWSREIDGVRYVNDSKATNTAAARQALTAFDAPLHLILGGSLKGERFDEFAQDVARANVVTAYLIGEAAEPLSEDLGYASVPFFFATTLERAVAEAASAAQPGEVVLLSPACASYDQFRDFEQRGEEFRRLVENLRG